MVEIFIAVGCSVFVLIVVIKSIKKIKNGYYCSGDCSKCSLCNIKKDK